MDEWSSIPCKSRDFFLFATSIQCVAGALTPGVKRPGRESDHHLLLILRLRMHGAIPSLLIRLHGVVLS
jgi:hypothetical protein